jgi:hypothetical protein
VIGPKKAVVYPMISKTSKASFVNPDPQKPIQGNKINAK